MINKIICNFLFLFGVFVLVLVFMPAVHAATTVGANITSGGTLAVATSTIIGNLTVQDAGNSVFLFADNNNHRIGIGTTTPETTLQIDGRVYQTGLGYSTFFGYQAGLNDDLTNNYNTAFGYHALKTAITGSYNVAVGYGALYSDTTGVHNVAVGFRSLYFNTTGLANAAIGFSSLSKNTSGESNTAVGWSALSENTTGSDNAVVGQYAAGNFTEGSWNTAVGSRALINNWTKSFANTAIGYEAGAAGSSGYSNASSTWVGYQAGMNIRTGSSNIALGYKAADNLTTGSNNIIIGYDIDAPSATGSNRMSIGNVIFGTEMTGTGTTIAGKIGIATSSPADLYGFTVATSTLQYGNMYVNGTVTASQGLVAPTGTATNVGDSCAGITVGTIRIDTDAAVGSRIIWCDGSVWQAN